jgi:hypothetical protein
MSTSPATKVVEDASATPPPPSLTASPATMAAEVLTRENAPPIRTSEPPVSVPKLQFARPAPLSKRPRLVGRKATDRPVVETKPPSWNFGWTAVAPRPCSVVLEPISKMLRPVSLRYRLDYTVSERETLFRHSAASS